MRTFPIVPAAFVAALGVAAEPSPARADSPVAIAGGDEAMRETIEDLLPDRDPPESLFDAERIGEEAAARALAWLRSEGYYAATATPEARDDPPAARLAIAPGQRFRFTAPALVFTGPSPEAQAVAAATAATQLVRAEAPARAGDVLRGEAAALAALQNAGYPDATPGGRRVVVDHATATVATEFRFTAGERVRLVGVRAEPGNVFRDGYIDTLRNWNEGDAYTPQALARLRRDLAATGAVSLITTRLEPSATPGVRDVVIEIEPARANAYELGVSYSTTEGPGLTAEWTRRNFTGRADALTLASTLAEMQQIISAEWARPHAAGLGRTLTLGAAAGREMLDAYSRQGVSIYGAVDASPRLRLGRSYGLSLAADQYDDLAGAITDAIVLSGFISVRNDTTETRLDPRDGSIVELRLEPSASAGDQSLGFVRAIADGRVYESLGDDERLTLAARARIGWLEPVLGDADDVPPDRRFYAGGGGSVRGYEYNSIYPEERDLLGLTPGGQGALEGSVEARWRFDGPWGAAAFVDAGNAFDSWGDAADLSWSVGIGARYDLGFAPLRIDIAFPLDDDETSDSFALYVSLGQAF